MEKDTTTITAEATMATSLSVPAAMTANSKDCHV